MGSLDGKNAIVTGGASGIGRAVAERLAAEGASMTVADVDEEAGNETARSIGGHFVRCDVSDPAQLDAAVAEARGAGYLDIAHLNAGITTGENDLTSLSRDAYRRAMGINLDGVIFGTKSCLGAMRNGGSIITTASLAGLGAMPSDIIYSVNKHAVVGFVRSAAPQLAEHGISINAICPGFVDTPILGPFGERFRQAGFPLLEATEVADALMKVLDSGLSGEVFVVQPGLIAEPYRFRGLPGPRTEGAQGMVPPVQPGP
ncbi:MAG: SDR family oxidoreductase [Actinobacteria bacterium]|nr:SDR family oxidoreductase [Actinomycetota bacterium]